jgi:hypothetical protein
MAGQMRAVLMEPEDLRANTLAELQRIDNLSLKSKEGWVECIGVKGTSDRNYLLACGLIESDGGNHFWPTAQGVNLLMKASMK